MYRCLCDGGLQDLAHFCFKPPFLLACIAHIENPILPEHITQMLIFHMLYFQIRNAAEEPRVLCIIQDTTNAKTVTEKLTLNLPASTTLSKLYEDVAHKAGYVNGTFELIWGNVSEMVGWSFISSPSCCFYGFAIATVNVMTTSSLLFHAKAYSVTDAAMSSICSWEANASVCEQNNDLLQIALLMLGSLSILFSTSHAPVAYLQRTVYCQDSPFWAMM